MKESELRCTCSPEARPKIVEATRIPWPHPVYVKCNECELTGELGYNKWTAMYLWVHRERTAE